jgi:hypothetical protein
MFSLALRRWPTLNALTPSTWDTAISAQRESAL